MTPKLCLYPAINSFCRGLAVLINQSLNFSKMLQSSIKIRPIIDLTAEVGLDESHLVIDLGSEEDLEERHLWSILPICLCTAFTCPDPKSAKKRVKPLVSFCAFGICTRKSCW